MKYSGFEKFFTDINIRNITKLFEAYKWIAVDEISKARFRVYYKLVDKYKVEVLLPKASAKGKNGYTNMILESIDKFAKIEGFSISEIIKKIASPDSNIINIRYVEKNLNISLIPGQVISNMIEGSKKLYIHSFLDLNKETRKSYRRGRLTKDAEDILTNIYFGQTEIGSYILPMYLPKGNMNENDIFDYLNQEVSINKTVSKETKAIEKMFQSLEYVTNIAEKDENFDSILNIDNDNFVSVNFIDALSDIGINNTNAEVEFVLDSNSLKNDVIDIKPVIVKSDYVSKLKQFVNDYKSKIDINNEIIGRLKKFDAEPEIDNRDNIFVQIKGLSRNNEDLTKNCVFDFDEAIQHIILESIDKGSLVRITGESEGKKLIHCTIEIL